MMVISLNVETIKIIQDQMYQISLENANTSGMKMVSSLLIKLSFIVLLYIMEAVIKEVYESNFGTAYETYKEAVKKDNSIDCKMLKTI